MKKNNTDNKTAKASKADETANSIAEDVNEACEEPCTETVVSEPESQEDILKKQNAEYLDRLQRTMAEFDNYRKRTVKEKAGMYDDGIRDTIGKLLPIVDNFERAIASVKQEKNISGDGFYKGIIMIQKQLEGFLDEIGVETDESLGETFDTSRHFAVAHVEDENYGAGEIIEVLQKGYIYKNKVIRCSMVKVAN